MPVTTPWGRERRVASHLCGRNSPQRVDEAVGTRVVTVTIGMHFRGGTITCVCQASSVFILVAVCVPD